MACTLGCSRDLICYWFHRVCDEPARSGWEHDRVAPRHTGDLVACADERGDPATELGSDIPLVPSDLGESGGAARQSGRLARCPSRLQIPNSADAVTNNGYCIALPGSTARNARWPRVQQL